VNQQQLLIKARRDHDMTLEAFGGLFECTKQHIYQIEQGITTLSSDRIQVLASNTKAPEWARSLAFQLWLLILTNDYAEMFAQLETLRRIVFPNNGAKHT
jgi:transcriptional regulator with XRE-family HTH domain